MMLKYRHESESFLLNFFTKCCACYSPFLHLFNSLDLHSSVSASWVSGDRTRLTVTNMWVKMQSLPTVRLLVPSMRLEHLGAWFPKAWKNLSENTLSINKQTWILEIHVSWQNHSILLGTVWITSHLREKGGCCQLLKDLLPKERVTALYCSLLLAKNLITEKLQGNHQLNHQFLVHISLAQPSHCSESSSQRYPILNITDASPNSSKVFYAAEGKWLLEWQINHNEKPNTTAEPAPLFLKL